MKEFRKKQKRLKKTMNALIIATVLYIVCYIGIQPSLPELIGQLGTFIVAYLADFLVVATMVILFIYSSRYGSSDKALEAVEYEISDAGYYITSRDNATVDNYYETVVADLRSNSFKVDEKIEIDGFEFAARAMKKNDVFYIVCDETIDKNDVIAYQQSAIYDFTAVNVKRKGNAIVLFIADKIEESAIELSKMTTPIGKKGQIVFVNSLVDVRLRRVYFLGNMATKCQKMIANFVMNCDTPIKEKYICNNKLDFQYKLEKHMEDFNIKEFKNGKFYIH